MFPMDQAVFILSAFLCLNVLTPDAALWVGTRVIPTFQMRELNTHSHTCDAHQRAPPARPDVSSFCVKVPQSL